MRTFLTFLNRAVTVSKSVHQIGLALLMVAYVVHEIRKEYKANHAWKAKRFPRRPMGEAGNALDDHREGTERWTKRRGYHP